jgi:hypothetical protein
MAKTTVLISGFAVVSGSDKMSREAREKLLAAAEGMEKEMEITFTMNCKGKLFANKNGLLEIRMPQTEVQLENGTELKIRQVAIKEKGKKAQAANVDGLLAGAEDSK